MKFDIALRFIPLTGGSSICGFLTTEPFEGTLDNAERAVSDLKSKLNHMSWVTIFTRSTDPTIGYALGTELGAEIRLGEKIIEQCVLVSQIIKYD